MPLHKNGLHALAGSNNQENRKMRTLKLNGELKRANEALQAEISKRELAEQRVEELLKEKEVLLQEIHHRVKNNLQIISSLLNLQSKFIKDPHALDLFKDSQNRIKSIALIHEKLYESPNLDKIDFAEYVQYLTTQLLNSFGVCSQHVTLRTNIQHTCLGIDAAITCGLIINELVSNSLRYAFPGGREAEITIDFCSAAKVGGVRNYILMVRDNGIGLPNGFDFRKAESLGMQLINTLTEQLRGTIEQVKCEGTGFKISFPSSFEGTDGRHVYKSQL